jgi:hypothetical protein
LGIKRNTAAKPPSGRVRQASDRPSANLPEKGLFEIAFFAPLSYVYYTMPPYFVGLFAKKGYTPTGVFLADQLANRAAL